METRCPKCGQQYGKRNRCYVCQPGNRKSGATRACRTCGVSFYVQANQLATGEGKYCSYACKHVGLTGVQRVVGSRYVRKDGYVAVKVGIRKYDLEHRVVVEQAIGRKLVTDEQIHHINGIKHDNRLENLQLLTNAEHQKLHDHLDVQHSPRTVTLVCEICAEEYQTRPSRAATSSCCSQACRLIKMRASRQPKK